MPSFTATLDKLNIIADCEQRWLDGYYQYTVANESSNENTTTTFLLSGMGSVGPDYFIGANALQWVLVEAATQSIVGQYRRIISVTPSSGNMVFTVDRAFTATITDADTVSFHRYRPDRFTAAYNTVVQTNEALLYKLQQISFPARSMVYDYGLPVGFTDVHRVLVDHEHAKVLRDRFDRTASTSDPGIGLVAVSGTWGVNSSEQLYSSSDTASDILKLTPDPNENMKNANIHIEARFKGDVNSDNAGGLATGTDYRTFAILPAYKDATNFLAVYMLDSVVAIAKADGGVVTPVLTSAATTTTNNVWYRLVVRMVGDRVLVWVDGVQKLNYQLTGTNTRYLEYEGVAVELLKSGTPTIDMVVDDLLVSHIVPTAEIGDWEVSRDRTQMRFGVRTTPYAFEDDQIVTVEGTAALSRLGADTTGALGTLTTDTVEMASTDIEYDFLLAKVAAAVMRRQAMDIGADGNLTVGSERLRALAAEKDAEAAGLVHMPEVGGSLVFA